MSIALGLPDPLPDPLVVAALCVLALLFIIFAIAVVMIVQTYIHPDVEDCESCVGLGLATPATTYYGPDETPLCDVHVAVADANVESWELYFASQRELAIKRHPSTGPHAEPYDWQEEGGL